MLAQAVLLWTLIAFGTLASAACGQPHTQWESERSLLEADRLADRQEFAAALVEYRRLQGALTRDDLVRYAAFREALMFERMERWTEALEGYALLWTRPVSLHDERAAQALLRSAAILDRIGEPERGLEMREAVALRFPNTAFGSDAFRLLRQHWIDSGVPHTQLDWTVRHWPLLRQTELSDTVIYLAAVTIEEVMDDCATAITIYHQIPRTWTRSGLVDDAIWREAGCWRALGDIDNEERILNDFLDGREISLFMGNYDSRFYNPALLRLAEIRAEHGDIDGEIAALRRFIRVFPLSLSVPEVRFRIVELHARNGDPAAMAREARRIVAEHPDSRWGPRAMRLVEEADSRR